MNIALQDGKASKLKRVLRSVQDDNKLKKILASRGHSDRGKKANRNKP